ncbi:hypothetical protein pdam_00024352 [Pocillopora damicornis]|uniref:Uncharacterized protein n=1 Tax=Pocillopora damicornis TaxID=46731 RepID=A0A3M6TCC7_POCDA|nr:hypothetical protein pdam_00024352 [Pocillopora damicornis]
MLISCTSSEDENTPYLRKFGNNIKNNDEGRTKLLPVVAKKNMLPGSQINKLAEAMWLGSPFIIKPTKEQSGGFLGTLLASSGVHLLTNSTPLVAITIINRDDSVGKKYVDTIASNILGGSETFQGDINMNSHRIKNVHTPTSNNDATVIKDPRCDFITQEMHWFLESDSVYLMKRDTGPQEPKGDEGDKGYFGSDGKTAMAADLSMANNKIIHLATPADANDAVNESYVDTQTNNSLKTDRTKPMSADLKLSI